MISKKGQKFLDDVKVITDLINKGCREILEKNDLPDSEIPSNAYSAILMMVQTMEVTAMINSIPDENLDKLENLLTSLEQELDSVLKTKQIKDEVKPVRVLKNDDTGDLN